MAFDQPTRNRLASFVADARELLAGVPWRKPPVLGELGKQLAEIYGISANGEIAPLEKLGHLDEAGLAIATLLRERIEYLERAHPDDKEGTKAAVARLAREQAFTILNRLAAVRMAEKRGIIVESVGRGYQSKGFLVFSQVTGSALGETYERFRRYLFCLFDELADDLGGLFDRRAPQGLLFPRESALLDLFKLLNAPDLDPLWAEDEAIGWTYQYYNDPEERKKMRLDSSAPRSSRELAVRNQFFTPRYVVEFLADNTLGRLWYEMTQGETGLKDQCRYLVRRPNEIFLPAGGSPPSQGTRDSAGVSQEELLRLPVYLPHRQIKDPREIRMLDPACGSMHFGLYAFDLFETIYEEAWDTAVGIGLKRDYPSKEDYLKDVPRLIVEHNIHGVDIDPRAVQIAVLSLWLRAQKAWQTRGVGQTDRPRIRRSNVVCAEAMPGSPEMLADFAATLEPPLLGELVSAVFDKMKLAGEAGSLLGIDVEIRSAIEVARVAWAELDGKSPELFDASDSRGQTGEAALMAEFWETAELQVVAALRDYAEQAAGNSYQRKLFADDAARGFAFIDLCSRSYDVILMNPPFGDASKGSKGYIDANYPRSKGNLLANFVEMGSTRLEEQGLMGAIVSRTCFYLKTFTEFRQEVLGGGLDLCTFADLGHGVLDAMVETAAATWQRKIPSRNPSCFIRALLDADKARTIESAVRAFAGGTLDAATYCVEQSQFARLAEAPFVYWIGPEVIETVARFPTIDPTACSLRVGLQTGDDQRFLRLWNEVPVPEIISAGGTRAPSEVELCCLSQSEAGKCWAWYSKTEEASPFLASIHMCVNWRFNGAEIKAYHQGNGHSPSKYVMSEDHYFRPGFSYMLRSVRLVPYAVPSGTIPTAGRSQVYPREEARDWLLILLASNLATSVARFRGENFLGPKFQNSMVGGIPYMTPEPDLLNEGLAIADERRAELSARFRSDETEILFVKPAAWESGTGHFPFNRQSLLSEDFEKRVGQAYGFTAAGFEALVSDFREAVNADPADDEELGDSQSEAVAVPDENAVVQATLLYSLGAAFGRWDIRFANGSKPEPVIPGPFDPLPICAPGMLQNGAGMPAAPEDLPHDYPLRISWKGILVDDPNHPEDIEQRVREALSVMYPGKSDAMVDEVCVRLGLRSFRDYFRRPSGMFADALFRYSKSRRQAPIYLPLSTASGSYTLWLYYHRLTDQTLHTCLADFLLPRISVTERELESARVNNAANSGQLQEFLDELRNLREEIERVIKLPWRPDLNDGVLITTCPLWKLFRHGKWQRDLKACWEKLAKGEYDWAHLAHSIWPERVEKVCERDRSIAIAHGLERLCKIEQPKPKARKAGAKKKTVALVAEAQGELLADE